MCPHLQKPFSKFIFGFILVTGFSKLPCCRVESAPHPVLPLFCCFLPRLASKTTSKDVFCSPGGKSGRPFGGRLSLSSFKDKPGLGSQNSLAGGANARSSYRGSVEPEVESGTLQKHALYIFGEKSQVKGVNVEKFPKADFIPVEYPEPKRLRASFRKLMRACAPSSLQQGGELTFHKQV